MWTSLCLLSWAVSPTPSPSQDFWRQVTPKDRVSFSVAIAALVISLANTLLTSHDRRRQTAIQTFLELIENLEGQSDQLIGRVQSNLAGRFDDEPADDHRAKNQILYEKLETEVINVARHLRPREAKDISDELHNFWRALTGSGYPLFHSDQGLSPDSTRWQSATEASRKWTDYLAKLRQQCAQHKLRCW